MSHCNVLSEAGTPTQHPEVMSEPDGKFEDDVETPKKKPQYWDITF